ncbi:MAG: dTMP kinase [Bdellovibrionales bacterium]|nr:dTMP kinase [Bdellovibrionales bacterium]
MFITFEGGEGVGKTTQIARLAQRLEKEGREVVVTREPGGSTIANRIRSLILDPRNDGLVPLAELFLYEASRAQHLTDTVLPALARCAVVLCDRFADSSVVYQGAGRKIAPKIVADLNRIATGGLEPDLTFFFDLDPRIGLARVGSRGVMDRMEKEKLSFHQAVRRGYLRLAAVNRRRVVKVDASRSRDDITATVFASLEDRGVLHG